MSVGKARTDFYSTKGETLARTHQPCPKCGPGIFLAEHSNRRSCGRCGYMESRSEPKPVGKPVVGKAKPTKPA
ncbi:MAG: 30S ribosomal protein S27ae [Thermoplasmata archaeon]|nr:30S ribosomal protein S27ae [Thermoplasmata archaeon]MCI4338068.1 30S ribosomal protein S27ae [Thermoplasmata archaeon]MCI4341508.1 30S ribosomal protein S27ae [Thermoplasmata archaeon]